MQYPEFLITTAGQTLINQALANNNTLTDYSIWTKSGTSSFNASTTDIPGLAFMGVPSLMTSADGSQTYAVIHLLQPMTGALTVAFKIGNTIAGLYNFAPSDLSITMVVIRLTNVPAALFGAGVIKNDYISSDTIHVVLDDLAAKYSSKLPTLYEGNILFGTSTATPPVSEPMLKEIAVVESAEEFTKATQNNVSMAEVFNTWTRFSHHVANGGYSNEAYPAELSAWQYDAVNDLIRCTVNSVSTIGFISPQNVLNYDLDVTMGSTDADDDLIGLIACAGFINTANGNELRKLDYWRSPGGGGGTGGVRQNAGYPGGGILVNRNTAFKWGNGNYGATAAESGYSTNSTVADKTGWKYAPNGTRIRIERRGNILTMKASDLNSPDLLPASEVVVDLSTDSRFASFLGGARYGFICNSQLDSYWKVNTFIDYDKVIVDLRDNKVYVNDGAGNWVVDPSRLAADIILPGRFAYSTTNKKLYYRDTDGILLTVAG